MCLPAFRYNFEPGSKLILAGTIQFASSIQLAKQQLAADYPSLFIPQSKPLSPGLHTQPDRPCAQALAPLCRQHKGLLLSVLSLRQNQVHAVCVK